MKKLLLLCAAVFFSALTISARPTGFNVGGGVTYLGWTSNTGTKPLDYIGPYVEVGYDLKVAKNSYIYFGGRFSHGINMNPEYKNQVYSNVEYGIGDLFIPIRFQQNFNVGKNTTLYLEAGPAAGVLLYNYYQVSAVSEKGQGSLAPESLIYDGEPRGNVFLGGNFGVNIHKHVKIYVGGDYGFIQFKSGPITANRWQLNFGACYVF